MCVRNNLILYKMKKYLLILIIVSISIIKANATHNRAGEITYNHISCNTYGITVTTYTNTNPATSQADRCQLTALIWKAGILIDSIVLPRANGPSTNCTFPDHDGQAINILSGTVPLYPFTNKNIYYNTYTFPESDTYQITMDDQNRNAGTCNINNGNSVNTSFSLISELVINPFFGYNNSSVLLILPLDQACVGNCFTHNPGAYDADGDSLSYSLVPCADNHGTPIAGWIFPPYMTGQSIDSIRGDVKWCSPNQVCNYNIAIKIKEYRLSRVTHQWNYMGYIIRDMQISVQSFANTPPQINTINDTTIAAGVNLQLNISATDAQTNLVTLSAEGGPIHIMPAATLTSTPSNSPVNGTFSWTPNCTEVREQPYLVTFKASDSDPATPLSTYKSIFIHVTSPPTDITGNVTYSGGNVTNGNAVLYNYNTSNSFFDTAQVSPLSSSGTYNFTNVLQGQYIVKIFPDSTSYPTLAPSYYSSQYLWGNANVINHLCNNNDTMNIVMTEKPTENGNGNLSGYVYAGVGYYSQPGNALPDIDMQLEDAAHGVIIANTTTNGIGYYSFGNLNFGTYNIWADIPGISYSNPYSRIISTGNLIFSQLNYYINCSSVTMTNILTVPFINPNEESITIAPNPFTSLTTISFSAEQTNTTIKITDILGKEIKALNFTGKQCTIEKGTMQTGIYFVQITDANKNVVNRKVVVQ